MESRNPPNGDLTLLSRASAPSMPSRNPPSISMKAPKNGWFNATKTPATTMVNILIMVSMFALIPNQTRISKNGFITLLYQVRTQCEIMESLLSFSRQEVTQRGSQIGAQGKTYRFAKETCK